MMTKISRSILAMCMCCALNFKALAVSDLPPNFKQLESQALKYLDDKKIDNEKRSALYLLAGREFYSYGLLDKSEEYYLKALNLNSSGKKAEAYINLVAIAVDNGNKDKTLKRFNSAEKYFKEHSNEKDSGVSLWLKTMDRVLRTPGKGSYRYTGLYGHYAALSDLRNFIEKRQYAKALSILNPTSISEASSPVVLISYDILRVLVHGKVEKKTLKCVPIQEKAAIDDNGYTIQICGILQDYLQSKKISPERLSKLEKYLSAIHRDKTYLLAAIKDLQ